MLMIRSATNNRIVPDVPSEGITRTIPAGRPDSPAGLRAWGISPQRSSKRKSSIADSNSSKEFESPRTPRRILKSLRKNAVASLVGVSPRSAQARQELQKEKVANRNLTQFLTADCPTDVLPKILAYAGPNSAAALQQTSRHFKNVLNSEGTWRGLCEELYKWKQGDPEPASWKTFYRQNPTVGKGCDFECITTALAMAGAGWTKKQVKKRLQASSGGINKQTKSPMTVLEIPESITVLVRPGHYELSEAIAISTLRRTTQVRIVRMDVPKGRVFRRPDDDESDDNMKPVVEEENTKEVFPNDIVLESKSRRRNEPLIRVFRGQVIIENMKLEHYSPGIDIWNGNSAIQVQPSADTPVSLLHPTLPEASIVLTNVDVRSNSGRGVVAVEGGHVYMEDCHIHRCAATGVYIGGRSSKAVLKSTDIVQNGLGNNRAGGIARGHSGLYVEQGNAELVDCSVSSNTAAGISVIAPDNSSLKMTESEVLSNGCTPVELPVAMNPMNDNNGNRIAVIGRPQPRSLVLRSKFQEESM